MIKVILDSQMCCRSKKDLLHQKNSILVYNPFVEDITDWKEKREYLLGKNKNITVYNICTIAVKVDFEENTWIGQ